MTFETLCDYSFLRALFAGDQLTALSSHQLRAPLGY